MIRPGGGESHRFPADGRLSVLRGEEHLVGSLIQPSAHGPDADLLSARMVSHNKRGSLVESMETCPVWKYSKEAKRISVRKCRDVRLFLCSNKTKTVNYLPRLVLNDWISNFSNSTSRSWRLAASFNFAFSEAASVARESFDALFSLEDVASLISSSIHM